MFLLGAGCERIDGGTAATDTFAAAPPIFSTGLFIELRVLINNFRLKIGSTTVRTRYGHTLGSCHNPGSLSIPMTGVKSNFYGIHTSDTCIVLKSLLCSWRIVLNGILLSLSMGSQAPENTATKLWKSVILGSNEIKSNTYDPRHSNTPGSTVMATDRSHFRAMKSMSIPQVLDHLSCSLDRREPTHSYQQWSM